MSNDERDKKAKDHRVDPAKLRKAEVCGADVAIDINGRLIDGRHRIRKLLDLWPGPRAPTM